MKNESGLKLDRLLSFSDLMNDYRRVERTIYANGTDRMENDTEHSFGLAMLGWYIIESEGLSMDTALVMKYALVHDLVEVYAGDTYIFTEDEKYKNSKEERESEAAKKLMEKFKEFTELHDLIEQYEGRANRESRFVYALDKVQPLLNIYLDDGRTWKENKVTLEMLYNFKKDQVSVSSEVKEYFDELIALLDKERGTLFKST